MIKPNELRKGNLIKYTGTPYPFYPIKDGIVEVEEILQDGVNRSQGDSTLYNIELLEGIPITPEWLERMAIKAEKGLYKFQHTDFYLRFIDHVVDVSMDSLDGLKKHYLKYNIRFVHQLQNIYFVLIDEDVIIKDTL